MGPGGDEQRLRRRDRELQERHRRLIAAERRQERADSLTLAVIAVVLIAVPTAFLLLLEFMR